jgi:outer membrane protein OmpA-like peptidoglycan-associated protein
VKSYLSELGIPTAQMYAADMRSPTLQRTGDTIWGAVQFAFAETVKNDDRLQAIKQALEGKPIVLHFETNQAEIALTEEQRKDFSDLAYYLDHQKGSKIAATGFTDNQGAAAKNKVLGQQRADFVRGYLANQGVNAQQIGTASKGMEQPVATNVTNDGRAQNRRVEISLQ